MLNYNIININFEIDLFENFILTFPETQPTNNF